MKITIFFVFSSIFVCEIHKLNLSLLLETGVKAAAKYKNLFQMKTFCEKINIEGTLKQMEVKESVRILKELHKVSSVRASATRIRLDMGLRFKVSGTKASTYITITRIA